MGAYYPNFTVVYHGTAICTTEQEELGGGGGLDGL